MNCSLEPTLPIIRRRFAPAIKQCVGFTSYFNRFRQRRCHYAHWTCNNSLPPCQLITAEMAPGTTVKVASYHLVFIDIIPADDNWIIMYSMSNLALKWWVEYLGRHVVITTWTVSGQREFLHPTQDLLLWWETRKRVENRGQPRCDIFMGPYPFAILRSEVQGTNEFIPCRGRHDQNNDTEYKILSTKTMNDTES